MSMIDDNMDAGGEMTEQQSKMIEQQSTLSRNLGQIKHKIAVK